MPVTLELFFSSNQMSSKPNIYIAVVDDDESVRRSFSRLLRAAHFQPIAYESAEAFLADRNQPKFGCLVLDIQLDGMSGVELKERLSIRNDDTPVVFITAYDDPAVCEQAEESGCVGFFRKTDSGSDVLSTIRRVTGMEG